MSQSRVVTDSTPLIRTGVWARRLRGWRRPALRALGALVLLLVTAAAIEQINEARDIAQYASHETFVALPNGSRIHYRLRGRESPGPTVVFLNGISGSAEQWDGMQSQMSNLSPSLAYDCGGTGLSSGSSAYDAQAQADELAALLQALAVKEKVVTVGFSVSGSLARVFAARHPDLVAGTVLLEPYLPEIEILDPGRQSVLRVLGRTLVVSSVESLFGLKRAAIYLGLASFEDKPRTELDFRCRAILLRFWHWYAVDREALATLASSRQALAAHSQTPLLVFTSGKSVFPHYDEVIDRFVASQHATLRQLGGIGHSDLLNSPQSIGTLVAGIEQFITQIRAQH